MRADAGRSTLDDVPPTARAASRRRRSAPGGAVTVQPPRRSGSRPDELRGLFLFEHLDDEQLAWICEHSDVVDVPAGQELVTEGNPADCFYVLLSGALVMSRQVGAEQVEINRTDYRGSYVGAVQFYLGDQTEQIYGATVRTTADSTFLARPGAGVPRRVPRLVPDGRAPAAGTVPRPAQHGVGDRPAGAAARAGQAVGGAHPRAEQPGRRRRARRPRPARPHHPHAQQAGDARRRLAGPHPAQAAGHGAGRVRREGAPRPGPHLAADLRRRGRADRLARRPRRHRRLAARPGLRRRRPDRRRPRRGRRRGPGRTTSGARCAGCPTRSRPRPCSARSSTRRRGSRRWSTRPSSTPRWTAPRTSGSTCTRACSPR